MSVSSIIGIVIATLLVYSLIGTVVVELSKENDFVMFLFSTGILGTLLYVFSLIGERCFRLCRHINQRSLWEEKKTKRIYKSKLKDTRDLEWLGKFKLIKRYATREEWEGIADIPAEVLKESRRNCDRCKYDEECSNKECIRCKHDEYGCVLEFDKFVEK